MKNNLAPVALFLYNRPSHTRETLDALANANLALDTDLVVFCDGPKPGEILVNINLIQEIILNYSKKFRSVEIFKKNDNQGLAKSIISGVDYILSKSEKIIVLEDDLVVSKYFLDFMNDALNLYSKDYLVGSIHGYLYPINKNFPETFFLRGAFCWGWATWARSWSNFERDGEKLINQLRLSYLQGTFDFDGSVPYVKMLKNQNEGKIDSWAIRWHANCFLKGYLQLFPCESLVKNIGFDGSGTHSNDSRNYAVNLSNRKIIVNRIDITENILCRNYFRNYFQSIKTNILVKIIIKLIKYYAK